MKKTESGHQLPFRVKRILLILLGLLLIAAGILVWRYIADYRNYNEYLSLIRQPEALAEAGGAGFPEDTLKAVPGFTLAADNGRMALYLKKETAEVALYDRQSGQTVYSNPPDADRDPVARATNLENLKSQFIISYLDANSKEGTAWSSWAKSVSNGQVEYEPLPDGVRVVYSLSGEKMLLVPDQLTPEWFAVLSEAGRKQAAKSYELNEASGLYEMKTRGVSARHRQQIDLDARGAGFTLEDYEEMQALKEDEEGGEEAGEILAFTVTLDWQLTEDGVRVTLPYEGLHESGKGKLRAVQLLPFFGAAGAEETGTLVLPEGSGALMRFNNGKSSSPQYSKNVYDLDLVDSDYSATQNMQSVRLALFGICRESSSVLAVCERGASLAAITADTSGRNNSYNFAYFTFSLRRTDTLSIVGEEVIVAEKDLYPVDCSVRYTLLGEDRAGPSGMARACREKLIREGALAEAGGSAEDLPFYYDVIGGIKETAHFLGIQYLRVLPMTTFSQAEEIVSRLRHEGIANQCVNLLLSRPRLPGERPLRAGRGKRPAPPEGHRGAGRRASVSRRVAAVHHGYRPRLPGHRGGLPLLCRRLHRGAGADQPRLPPPDRHAGLPGAGLQAPFPQISSPLRPQPQRRGRPAGAGLPEPARPRPGAARGQAPRQRHQPRGGSGPDPLRL